MSYVGCNSVEMDLILLVKYASAPVEAQGMEEEGVKDRGGRQREGGIATWLFDVDRVYEKDPDK
jgi:hypothetical protein